jgi:hypothetical protein
MAPATNNDVGNTNSVYYSRIRPDHDARRQAIGLGVTADLLGLAII